MSINNLKERYQREIAPQLKKEWQLKNLLAVPRVEKVIINLGIGEGAKDKGALEKPSKALSMITGQKPKVAPARVSVAGFRLREGAPIGLVVTLRRQRMYSFLEKLFGVVLPRLRDFQGVSPKSFDNQGNYSLGIPEMTVFPEAEAVGSKGEKIWGLQITLVTNTKDDQKAKRLLELMGMPFEKPETKSEKQSKG